MRHLRHAWRGNCWLSRTKFLDSHLERRGEWLKHFQGGIFALKQPKKIWSAWQIPVTGKQRRDATEIAHNDMILLLREDS
jgi:hypothetical protein